MLQRDKRKNIQAQHTGLHLLHTHIFEHQSLQAHVQRKPAQTPCTRMHLCHLQSITEEETHRNIEVVLQWSTPSCQLETERHTDEEEVKDNEQKRQNRKSEHFFQWCECFSFHSTKQFVSAGEDGEEPASESFHKKLKLTEREVIIKTGVRLIMQLQ